MIFSHEKVRICTKIGSLRSQSQTAVLLGCYCDSGRGNVVFAIQVEIPGKKPVDFGHGELGWVEKSQPVSISGHSNIAHLFGSRLIIN